MKAYKGIILPLIIILFFIAVYFTVTYTSAQKFKQRNLEQTEGVTKVKDGVKRYKEYIGKDPNDIQTEETTINKD